jgi:hypothetical protein
LKRCRRVPIEHEHESIPFKYNEEVPEPPIID